MRKVVLHIAFLCLLLSSAIGHSFALVNPSRTVGKIEQAISESGAKVNFAPGDVSFFKNDLINDVDEFDEFDFDEHDNGLRERTTVSLISDFKSSLLAADFNSKAIGNTIYTHHNLSRIPRYNYITLRVFRI